MTLIASPVSLQEMFDIKPHILLHENPGDVSEAEFEAMLARVPEFRREKALRFRFFKDRVLSVLAYRLLTDGLKEFYGIECPGAFGYNEYGKPYLQDHAGIHFSLSHCDKAVGCAIWNHPVGLDVEVIENSDVEAAKIWTRKEAYVKLTGTGISDGFPDIIIPENIIFDTTILEGVVCTVAYKL